MKRFFMMFIAIAVLSTSAFAQYSVKGVVVDKNGEPVIGAAVLQQGTMNGAQTGIDGDFTLNVPSDKTILEISFLGYKTVTIEAGSASRIEMADDTEFLDEVVVIGYGTVKKSDMTGAVAAIKADELNKGMISSPSDLLRGKSAGVVVTAGNGQPGSSSTIRIRGGSSLSANNDPLIVIDGLPVGNSSISGLSDPLSTINPSDIESFTVLKDASATAIYGSRASNGVIVITTKKGSKSGVAKPTFNFDYTASLSTNAKYVDVMTADQIRSAISTIYGTESDAYKALGSASTDWQKEIYQNAQTHEANLSVTGGQKIGEVKLPYRVSLGALSQDGILKTSAMQRLTGSLNLSPSLLDDHLTVNLNGKGTYAGNDFANDGAVGSALHYDPTKEVYDSSANGLNGYSIWRDAAGNVNTMATQNPVAQLNERTNTSNVFRFIGNAQFDYKFHGFEDLRFNLNLGLDYSSSEGNEEAAIGSQQSYIDKQQSGSGFHNNYSSKLKDETLEAYLAYNHDFNGGHHFDAMAGYSWQHFYKESANTKVKLTDGLKIEENNDIGEYYLVSFFGRVNYSYKDRYMLTATLRRDGTSRFSNNQWGLFPSVALGWNIKNEEFLKDSQVVSSLKLRLSYGQTGQQDLNAGYYPTLATYVKNSLGSKYIFNGQVITPLTALGYNADLKWETTTTENVGLDFGFANGRIYGSVDVYKRITTDLINEIPAPALSNLTNSLVSNIGSMENKGFEAELNGIILNSRNWSWTLGANVAYNHNEITKLTALEGAADGIPVGGISGGTGNTIQLHQVGFPTNAFYVYQQVYDGSGNPIPGVYVDRYPDGTVNEADKYLFHKPAADYTFGMNSSLSYKNWTLAVSGHGSLGNWVYNNVQSENYKLVDLWTNSFVSNRVNGAVEAGMSAGQFYSDMFVQDASFFKIDNVTLNYYIPSIFRSGDRALGANVFATCQNCFTFTKYTGIDPEVFSGIDGYIYPRPRTFVLGVKLNF